MARHSVMLVCAFWAAFSPPTEAAWERLGPTGGRVSALCAAPSRPSTLYAGGAAVFRSTDSGETWTAMAFPFPSQGPEAMPARVTVIAVCPTDENRVLAATPQGLFLCTDGAAWRRAGSITVPIRAVAFAHNSLRAVASGPTTLSRTTDGGATWTSVSAPAFVAFCADPSSPGAFFGALASPDTQGRSVLHSPDGLNWTPLPAKDLRPSALRPTPDGTGVYAAVPGEGGGLFLVSRTATEAARLSVHPSVDLAAPAALPGWLFSASDAAWAAHPAYRTEDGGAAWKALRTGFGPCGISAFTLGADYTPLAGSDGSGVLACDGTDTWHARNTGLEMAWVTGAHMDGDGRILAAAADGLYAAEPGGQLARIRAAGKRSVLAASPAKPGRFYYTGPTALEVSDDGGRTWRSLANSGLPAGATVTAVAAHPTLPHTVFATLDNGAVYRSTGSVAAFKRVLDPSAVPPAVPPDILPCPSDPDAVYAVRADGLHASADGGLTWERRGDTPANARLAVEPKDASTVYRAATTGTTVTVSRSTNGGAAWTTLRTETGTANGGFAATFLARDPRAPGRLLLGTNRGLRVSDNGGLNWRVEDTGPPAANATCWAQAAEGADLVGTDGAGLLRSTAVPKVTADLVTAAGIMRLRNVPDPTPEQLAWADRDGDGSITPTDAALVLRIAGGCG